MATNRRTPPKNRRTPPDRRPRPDPRRKPSSRRRPARPPRESLLQRLMAPRRQADFRPDSLEPGFFKRIYMTKLQRLHLLRWVCYVAFCVGLLVIQDVIMSRVTLFGTTTDLAAMAILLLTVMEGSSVGSVFVLIASLLYYLSGSAPGPFCVALLSVFGIFATLFRQAYWHRNKASILLCAGVALMLYELGVYVAGSIIGLTNWYRIATFLITGAMSWVVMILVYPLADRIGQIGGHTWKE